MIAEIHSKVKDSHLRRDAYLYVRQSTVRQVFENTESTKRQYALRQRAVALGWPTERVHVIDTDLGQSGASAADREGFKKLITEVSLGQVGVVIGLEVSRLARNCADWHRLLELCALTDALILDEDGLYDPNDFNDRLLLGLNKGKLLWGELCHSRTLGLLHNPRYAGAFVFGRMHSRKGPDGRAIYRKRPREQWVSLIPGVHEGYISFEEYEDNQRRLKQCAQAFGLERPKSPPREGPALLQGIVICGVCGCRMTVRYHERRGCLLPQYICQRDGIENGRRPCQRIPGVSADRAIGALLMDTITPMGLEVAIAVQQELSKRLDEADQLRARQVERVRYETDLARQRYMQVDPNNRLVADVLEAEWNQMLRALEQAQEKRERQSRSDRFRLSREQRDQIFALAADFPKIWNDPKTADRERKRMIRLLIEDVTLTRGENIMIQVRFKSGKTATVEAQLPKPACKTWQTANNVVTRVDQLLENHTYKEIASILNKEGLRSGKNRPFNGMTIFNICSAYGLKKRWYRLRDRGLLTVEEMAAILKVSTATVKAWHKHGLLKGHVYNDKQQRLFEPPGRNRPVKWQGRKLSKRYQINEFVSDHMKKVQYEA
jgi:hypothetical protein